LKRLRRLTKNQMTIINELMRVGLYEDDHRVPHGVMRSLVIRGLVRQLSQGSYVLTPEGKNFWWTERVQTTITKRLNRMVRE
jgi:hypothetical protein